MIHVLVFSLIFLISCVKAKQQDDAKKLTGSTASMLLGDWVSADDPGAGLSISDTEFVQTYDGKAMERGIYVIADAVAKAKNDAANPSGKYVTVFDDDESFAYYIVDISGEKLSLGYVDRGNTLNYTRADSSQMLQADRKK